MFSCGEIHPSVRCFLVVPGRLNSPDSAGGGLGRARAVFWRSVLFRVFARICFVCIREANLKISVCTHTFSFLTPESLFLRDEVHLSVRCFLVPSGHVRLTRL